MEEIQKNIDIDWKKIDETINEAIKRDEPYIVFKFREIEEYRYIQKVAEVKNSDFGMFINGIYFIGAVGVSFVAGAISALISIRDISIIDLKKYSLFFVIGLLLLFIAVCSARKEKQYKVYNKIILNTEKKILWMEMDSKKSHSDVNHQT